jgi:excisionase family DNA binding protein
MPQIMTTKKIAKYLKLHGITICKYAVQGSIPAIRIGRVWRIVMQELLTTEELSTRIKLSPGTIRNLVWRGVFQLNGHYVKPRGKLLFIWSSVQEWLYGGPIPGADGSCNPGENEKCLIQI